MVASLISWSEHLLGAAGEQDHALLPLAPGGGGAGAGVGRPPRERGRGEFQHRHQLLRPHASQQTEERAREARRGQRQAEAARMRQHGGQQPAHGALLEAALPGRLDVGAGMVDEVHVVHPARAGGHAGEAGEAAVDMRLHRGAGPGAALEHLLHQVDAPARGIALVAEQNVGRAGGRAQPAVHALPQDAVDLRRPRVLELARLEVGLHGRVVAQFGPAA